MDRIDLKNLTKDELTAEMLRIGEKRFRADQMYSWMHQKLAASVSEMTNLSALMYFCQRDWSAITCGSDTVTLSSSYF